MVDSIDDYKNTRVAKNLVNQLVRIPTIKYFEHLLEPLLFRSLYCALSVDGKYYDYFLPLGMLSRPTGYDLVNDHRHAKNFFLDQENIKINSHLGHICAASIPIGKPVYNCFDCGVDPTCCLCEDCFNKEEHSDHNVSVHRSSGDAICDCGDVSSWKVDLRCKANAKEEILRKSLPSDLPADFKYNIKIIVRVLFDFILDVHSINYSALPNVHDSILDTVSKLEILPKFDDAYNHFKKPYLDSSSSLSADDIVTGDLLEYYYLIVWNDEFHNFDEAISFLSSAYVQTSDTESDDHPFYQMSYDGKPDFEIDGDRVANMAKTIDAMGFIAYARSKDLNTIKSKTNKFDQVNRIVFGETPKDQLRYSILNGRQYANLVLSTSAINWFDVILKNKNIILTDFIKQEISNVLFERANLHLTQVPYLGLWATNFTTNHKLEIPLYEETIDRKSIPLEKLGVKITSVKDRDIDGKRHEDNDSSNSRVSSSESFDSKADSIDSYHPVNYYDKGTRLQYLIFFEMRFPKRMRKLLKKTIIPTITNSVESRYTFAEQVTTLLPTFEFNTAFYDREWQLSLLETFRLQVYHDPNLGTQLLENGLLENVIDSLIRIFSCVSIKNNKFYAGNKTTDWKYYRSFKVLTQTFDGLHTILNFIHQGNDRIFNNNWIVKLLRIFTAFDNIFTIVRETDQHIEFFNQRECSITHSQSYTLYRIAEHLGNIVSGIAGKNENVERSIILLSSYLKNQPVKLENGIVKYDITKDGATVIHPIGSLLADLSKSYKAFESELLNYSVGTITYNEGKYDYEIDFNQTTPFLIVADTMVRSWTFQSQISSNFWVRNGGYIEYAKSYFEHYFPENILFIMQQAILLDQLPLDDVIDRFMLSGCIHGSLDFTQTIYEEKISIILDEFAQLMYYILTFRVFYDSQMDHEGISRYFEEYKLSYVLASSPKKFSEIEQFARDDYFDETMEKITNYVPPASLNDYGRYELKSEYLHRFDPYLFSPEKTGESEIEESILKNISNVKNKKVDDVVLIPYLYPLKEEDLKNFKKIGDYMRSKEFAKILYKILRFAVSSDYDTHLNMVLQLIHAIVMDSELYYGDSKSLQNFIEIPICNMLLSAAEKSDVPKYITKKASTILEIMLLKNDDVLTSLVDCFGEAHIEEYKKSKQGKNLETKMERKRRLALKRQKKILQKMQKQQTNFMSNNESYFQDECKTAKSGNHENVTDNENLFQQEIRTCVLCKNPENDEDLFGLPGFLSTSSIFWTIPTISNDTSGFMISEFENKNKGDLDDGSNKKSNNNNNMNGNQKESCCTREKIVATGCPHGMHLNCFKTMLSKKGMSSKDYLCPLCKGKSNIFIPAHKSKEFEIDPDLNHKLNFTYNDIFSANGKKNIAYFSQQFFGQFASSLETPNATTLKLIDSFKTVRSTHNELLDRYSIRPEHWKVTTDISKFNFISEFNTLSIIGSTLEMYEISSRKEDQISLPEIALSTLRSLLQQIIFTHHINPGTTDLGREYYEFLLNNPNVGFVEQTLLLYFKTDIDLLSCMKISIVKRMILTAISLFQRYEIDPRNVIFESILDANISQDFVTTKLCEELIEIVIQEELIDPNSLGNSPLISRVLYKVMVTNFGIFHRQIKYISIFMNLITKDEIEIGSFNQFVQEMFKDASKENKMLRIVIKGLRNTRAMTSQFASNKMHKRGCKVNMIEYPKPVHFIHLPEKLKDLALEASQKKTKVLIEEEEENYDYWEEPKYKHIKTPHICLHCGKWLTTVSKHNRECQLSGYSTMIFSPEKNHITLHFSEYVTDNVFHVESPYLNKHGEPSKGIVGFGDAGTLDLARYKHIQNMWYGQFMIIEVLRNDTKSLVDGVFAFSIPGISEDDSFRRERFSFASYLGLNIRGNSDNEELSDEESDLNSDLEEGNQRGPTDIQELINRIREGRDHMGGEERDNIAGFLNAFVHGTLMGRTINNTARNANIGTEGDFFIREDGAPLELVFDGDVDEHDDDDENDDDYQFEGNIDSENSNDHDIDESRSDSIQDVRSTDDGHVELAGYDEDALRYPNGAVTHHLNSLRDFFNGQGNDDDERDDDDEDYIHEDEDASDDEMDSNDEYHSFDEMDID